MPSKLRYILLIPEAMPVKGSIAVALMCKMVYKNVFKLTLPKNWHEFKTRDRLSFLSQFLPPGHKFFILREPKWTRKNKSKYVQAFKQGQLADKFLEGIKVEAKPLKKQQVMDAVVKKKKMLAYHLGWANEEPLGG